MAQGRLRRLVTRRRVKWAGLVLCAVVLGVYVASAWYWVSWVINKPNQSVYIGVFQGRLAFTVADFASPPFIPSEGFHLRPLDNPSIVLRPRWPTRFTSNLPGFAPTTGSYAELPLWLPLLLIAAPTVWLWYTDRRVKPWQCPKCRYDLRGLDGGVCPECGESTEDACCPP